MTKKKSDHSGSPVRLKSKIKHYHQSYFLHYINEEVPEISEKLKKLTPICVELFGEFPVTIHTQNDYLKLGVWFRVHEDQRQLLWNINTVLRECIWKESRDRYGSFYWLHFLRKNDKDLNQILEVEENIQKETFQIVELLNEEQLDSLKDFASSIYTTPKDALSLQNLQFLFWELKEGLLRQNDETYIKLINLKYSKLEALTEFQNDFDLLLKRFRLEKEWLAESVFRAIWSGTGKLQIEASYIEEIPKEITLDIEKRLGISREFLKLPNKDEPIEITPLWEGEIPPPEPFTFQEQYWIYSSFEEYKEKAAEAYRKHLENYFEVIKETFENQGYKKKQGRPHDFERVKWLVFYIVKNWAAKKVMENFNIEDSTFWDALVEFNDSHLPTKKKSHTPENSP